MKKNETDKPGYSGNEIKEGSLDEKMAGDLVEEYTDRLRAGENPDPEEYVARYTGSGKNKLRSELYFVIFLEDIYRPLGKERLNKIIPPERRPQIRDLVLTELHSKHQRQQKEK